MSLPRMTIRAVLNSIEHHKDKSPKTRIDTFIAHCVLSGQNNQGSRQKSEVRTA